MLYEPMGPTGDRRIPTRFAVPGQSGFPLEMFYRFLRDLKSLRLTLGPQKRMSYSSFSATQRAIRSLIGSRTRISYFMMKFAPDLRTIIWKDPMAALAVPAVLTFGFPTVICIRSPVAHAASFKRQGWKVNVRPIYSAFRSVYGELPSVERILSRETSLTSAKSASLMWNIIYAVAARAARGEFGQTPGKLLMIGGKELEVNEVQVYRLLYSELGLAFEGRPHRLIEARARSATDDVGDPKRTHNWQRSVATTNTYWREVLDAEEIGFASELNSRLYEELCGFIVNTRPPSTTVTSSV
ncbi:MAG: hypothetical protein H0T75_00900 [Rhizobiales bacterium]|nr:hypothetical protein [Hyphomicrobiales bacterium]